MSRGEALSRRPLLFGVLVGTSTRVPTGAYMASLRREDRAVSALVGTCHTRTRRIQKNTATKISACPVENFALGTGDSEGGDVSAPGN